MDKYNYTRDTDSKFYNNVSHLTKLWLCVTIISAISLLLTTALPLFISEGEYLELLFDTKWTAILFASSCVIFLVFLFLSSCNLNQIKRYIFEDLYFLSKLASYLVIPFIVLSVVMPIIYNVITFNNIKSFNGKVDSVTSISIKSNGDSVKAVKVSDSNNKQATFVTNTKLKNVYINKNDYVKIDYTPISDSNKIDGNIIGYSSKSN
ncbi:hypothetical protein [Staphylococcus aureus]|uniref:hypothetical protein n=1 Tax=Staphylococcus aureus TaxID=1280 RepID=UPI001CC5B404|nr:hypothetical protein [Staphylococcus aureus]MBZ5277324.1 hypothetical protein [Staphylococcus aureus]